MTSSLSDFAARLRTFIDESPPNPPRSSLLAEDGRFDELAVELFALQFDHNEAYRKLCQSSKSLERFQTIRLPLDVQHRSQIPAVPTSAFKELELTCLPDGHRQFVFRSSGTTLSRRSRHFHSSESLALYEASLLAWFRQRVTSDLREAMAVLSLTPPVSAVPDSSLVHMFQIIAGVCGDHCLSAGRVEHDGSWTSDLKAVFEFLDQITRADKPMLLLGTAFNFVHLIDHCTQNKLRFGLPAGSGVLETGGYKGRSRTVARSELHSMIAEQFGIGESHIITEYGMSELSSQAYAERGPDRSSAPPGLAAKAPTFSFPPWVRAEVISPETGKPAGEGQTGLIRVFDLANVWSVMAVQTEDLGIKRGRGFELLGRSAAAEPRGCSLMASEEEFVR